MFFSKFLGSLVSFVVHDTNVRRELKEYSTRLQSIIDKLQADLAERNVYNNHRTIRGKSEFNIDWSSLTIVDHFLCRISFNVDSPWR